MYYILSGQDSDLFSPILVVSNDFILFKVNIGFIPTILLCSLFLVEIFPCFFFPSVKVFIWLCDPTELRAKAKIDKDGEPRKGFIELASTKGLVVPSCEILTGCSYPLEQLSIG